MQVLAELKQRGVSDVLICCVDGLKGLPEAIEAIFPQTVVQTCVVQLIRHSLRYVPRREREQVARDLKPIYTAVDADAAQAALEAFDERWGARFPVIRQAWLNAWEYVTPFLAFPPELRRVVYTTNDRSAQPAAAQSDQDERTLPQRGGRPQTDLPRHRQRRAGVDANAELDDSPARVQDPLRRPATRVNRLHRKSDALVLFRGSGAQQADE